MKLVLNSRVFYSHFFSQVTQRPATAGALFKSSMIALVEKLVAKVITLQHNTKTQAVFKITDIVLPLLRRNRSMYGALSPTISNQQLCLTRNESVTRSVENEIRNVFENKLFGILSTLYLFSLPSPGLSCLEFAVPGSKCVWTGY